MPSGGRRRSKHVRAAARREHVRDEPSTGLAAQQLEPSIEPTPPAAAAPHLVAARPLRAPPATGGGAAHLAPVGAFKRAPGDSGPTRPLHLA
jgi:hypothetical protein